MKITQKGMNNHVSELIETLWNVNKKKADVAPVIDWRINRNIVECK